MKTAELQDGKHYWIKWNAKEEYQIVIFDKSINRFKSTRGSHMTPKDCFEINYNPIPQFQVKAEGVPSDEIRFKADRFYKKYYHMDEHSDIEGNDLIEQVDCMVLFASNLLSEKEKEWDKKLADNAWEWIQKCNELTLEKQSLQSELEAVKKLKEDYWTALNKTDYKYNELFLKFNDLLSRANTCQEKYDELKSQAEKFKEIIKNDEVDYNKMRNYAKELEQKLGINPDSNK